MPSAQTALMPLRRRLNGSLRGAMRRSEVSAIPIGTASLHARARSMWHAKHVLGTGSNA